MYLSLCGSVGNDFVYHACGYELDSRPKWKFSNFHHLWLLLSDYGGTYGSEPTIIRRLALVQQLSVRKEPGRLR